MRGGQRANTLLHRELSRCVCTELSDPRLRRWLCVNAVRLNRDGSCATVYVSHIDAAEPAARDDARDRVLALRALARATGFLRARVAARCALRSTPRLHFCWDDSRQRERRLSALLRRAGADDAPAQDPAC